MTPRYILVAAGAHLGLGALAGVLWAATGSFAPMKLYFQIAAPVFFVGMALVKLRTAVQVRSLLRATDKMAKAWMWITAAAVAHFCGRVIAEVLAAKTPLNPLYVAMVWNEETARALRSIGVNAAGMLFLTLLLAALVEAFRVFRDTGFRVDLQPSDYAYFGVSGLFAVVSMAESALWIAQGKPIGIHLVLSWMTDPLLNACLVMAIFLRRYALNLGQGLAANCWSAIAAGVFWMSAGDASWWANRWGYITSPWIAPFWFVWFVADAAFTLGPAYQLAALRTALAPRLGKVTRAA